MTLNEIKAALRAAGIDNFSGEAHILIKEFFQNGRTGSKRGF